MHRALAQDNQRAPDAAHHAVLAAWCAADPGSTLHAARPWVPVPRCTVKRRCTASGTRAVPSLPFPLFGAAHQFDPWLRCLHQAAIGSEVVERHAASGEARLKLLADGIALQSGEPADGGDRAGFVL